MVDATPFLPEDYSEPSSSDYVQLEQGTTKIRFIQSPVMSWEIREEYLNEKGETKKRVTRARKEDGQPIPREGRFTWTCVVWNHNDKRIQIRNITQKSIRDQLVKLATDKDFGSPLTYDVKVNKEGEGMTTKYTVQALPKSDLPEEAVNTILATQVNLDAYFAGDSAFAAAQEEVF